MTKRQKISVYVGTPRVHESFSGSYIVYDGRERIYADITVDGLIESLQELKIKYEKEYSDLNIVSVRDCGCVSYDCGCAPDLFLVGCREETDLELNYRLEEVARNKAEQEERERIQYEKLKEKFGD